MARAYERKGNKLRFLMAAAMAHQSDDCLQWPFKIDTSGYGSLHTDGHTWTAHRFVCRLAHGPAPSAGMHAAHSCGNRLCMNPRHLRWATPKENDTDKDLQGRRPIGAAVHTARLTEGQVRAIRHAIHHDGQDGASVAREYGLNTSTIYRIRDRKIWRHVE